MPAKLTGAMGMASDRPFSNADINTTVRVQLPRRLERDGRPAGERVWVQGRLGRPADERGQVTVYVMAGDRHLHQMLVPAADVERWEEPIDDGSRERPLRLWL